MKSRHEKTKIILAVLLISASLLIILSCSDKPGDGKKVKLKWAAAIFTPEREKLCQSLIEAYNKHNPDVEIELLAIARGFDLKVVVMYASDNSPDVVWAWDQQFWPWVNLGMVYNFDEKFKTDFDFSDFFPITYSDAAKYKGDLYSFDPRITAQCLFFNEDMFREVGLKTPIEYYKEGNWTWEKVLECAKKITRDSDGDGVIDKYAFFAGRGVGDFRTLWAFGAEMFNEDMTELTIDTPEAIAAYQFQADLIHKYKVTPVPTEMSSIGSPYMLFRTGRCAMYITGIWDFGIFRKNPDLNWDIAPMPKGPAGVNPSQLFLGGAYWAMSKTKHPEECWDFIKFLYSKEAAEINVKYGESPGRVSVANSPLFMNPDKKPKHIEYFLQAQREARPTPRLPEWTEFDQRLSPIMDSLWLGDEPAAVVCKRAVEEMNPWLKKKAEERGSVN